MHQNNGHLYNVQEAAVLLGIKVRTVRQWIASGKLTAVKNGKQWMINESEIDRILAGK